MLEDYRLIFQVHVWRQTATSGIRVCQVLICQILYARLFVVKIDLSEEQSPTPFPLRGIKIFEFSRINVGVERESIF